MADNNLDRKRLFASRAPLYSLLIWLLAAVLHAQCYFLGIAQISFATAGLVYCGVLAVTLAHHSYFRTRLCLYFNIPFRWIGIISVSFHIVLATLYIYADSFSYFTVLVITMGLAAAPAALGLNYGLRQTMLMAFVVMGIGMTLYFTMPKTPLTVPGEMTWLFLFAWFISWCIGAVVNEMNIRKKYMILTLFREQKEATEVIAEQNTTLDEQAKELHRVNEMLTYLSTMDALTQVANRRHFNQVLQDEWRRAFRHSVPEDGSLAVVEPDVLSLLLFDVDHFKLYNDTYGHLAGYACLSQVAQAIAECLNRGSDTVARYGGEEFVVLLPATFPDGAVNVAERVCRAVEALAIPHSSSPTAPVVTVSVGVAGIDTKVDTNGPTGLIGRADRALYEAKHLGRNRVVYCDNDVSHTLRSTSSK